MVKVIFGEITFSPDTVHNLWASAFGPWQRAKPVCEGVCFFCKTETAKCRKSESSIAKPGIPIIPVTSLAQSLWERSCRGSNNCPSRSVGHHFERQSAPMNLFNIRPMIGALGEPFAPTIECVYPLCLKV